MDTRSPATTRSARADVTSARKALVLVGPFIAQFEGWNHRAARQSAALLSSITDVEQKATARVELQKLRVEVREAFREFLARASTSTHSRVEDIRNAFTHLLRILDTSLD